MQSGIVENPLNEWRFTASVSPQGPCQATKTGATSCPMATAAELRMLLAGAGAG